MKARFTRFVGLSLLLSTLLILSPFSLNAAPRQQPDPATGEPNNSFGTATPIDVGATVEGTISPSGDADWYALTVDHQGELSISVGNVAEELAINVRVWNADEQTVSEWFAPLAAGGDTEGKVDLSVAGRYYIEVADGQGSAESDQPYSLQTSFTPTVDVDEPNNTFGSASPIAIGEAIQANILPLNDADWYNFEVPKQGELTVQIGDVADDSAVSFRVWDNDRNTISDWVSPLAKGGNTKGIIDLPTGGRYFLEVADNNGGYSTQPYTLAASFLPAVDESEPNDTFGASSPYTLGATIAANIMPQYDEDWYQVETSHSGELAIAITEVPENLAIHVRVWNSNKDTISEWINPLAAGGDTIGAVDLPSAGSYYLEVADTNNGRSIQPYNLTVGFTEALDPFDANDSFGHADPLTLGQSLVSNILPRGDRDWHQIDVDHQGQLQLSATAVPPNLDINFRVWDSEQNTISDWFHPLAQGGDTNGIVDIPAAGAYYIEVADGSDDARSILPFKVQALFLPTADQDEPNNDRGSATEVELDTTIAANILPSYDTDFYTFELADAGDLHLLVTNVAPNLEIVYRLWDDNDSVVADWTYPLAAGGDTEGLFTVETPGIYYLEVVDNNNNRSIQPYLLRLSTDEIDPTEMTYSQSISSTDVVTESVSTVEEGTEIVTATTTIMTTTITVQASGDVSESAIITATDAISETSVVTRPASTGVRPPSMPPPPGGTTTRPGSSEPVTATAEITETAAITETPEVSPSTEITESEAATTTGSLPPPVTTVTNNPSTVIPSAALPATAVIPPGETINVEGVDVVLPTGWQSAAESGPFRGLALNPDDLTAATPQGPRLWILSPGVGDLEFSGTLEATGAIDQVVESPATFQIGDMTALAIGVRETVGDQSVVRRYIYVEDGDGASYEFIMEAPAGQWIEQVQSLEGILASILINPS